LLRIPSYLPNIPAGVIPESPVWNGTGSVAAPAQPRVRKWRTCLRVLGAIMLVAISLVPTAIINQRTLLPYVREGVCWISAVRESFKSGSGMAETRVKKVKARRTVKPAEPLPAPVVQLDAYVVPIQSGRAR